MSCMFDVEQFSVRGHRGKYEKSLELPKSSFVVDGWKYRKKSISILRLTDKKS